jgi:hypothetical protein
MKVDLSVKELKLLITALFIDIEGDKAISVIDQDKIALHDKLLEQNSKIN